MRYRAAFSLVELSIVLVILGLLTGGILGGQSLIRAAEMRAISTEYQRFQTATGTFRDKYFSIPGDFRDATRFWGRTRSTGDCVSNSASAVATPGTCDGDGDGLIELPSAAWNPDQSGENFQFWRHMQLAGLVEGSITGLSPPTGGGTHMQPSYSMPSKQGGAYWNMFSDFTWVGAANFAAGTSGTNSYLLRGKGTYEGSLSQSEMWNIDTKIDDGIPTAGVIVTKTQGWGGPGNCVTGAVPNGVYFLQYEVANACQFVARNQL